MSSFLKVVNKLSFGKWPVYLPLFQDEKAAPRTIRIKTVATEKTGYSETLTGTNKNYNKRVTSFLRSRWLLLIALAVFISFKIPHLFASYYWDESWLYTPGIMAMYEHGPSLMPNAIDISFTRGHPLFFYAVFAVWVNIFGHSHFAMHSFSLLISLALIVIIYEAMLKLFNQKVAGISMLLLMLNTTFFVQSSFIIPDIMIALFVFSALYFYATQHYFLTAVTLTLLLYTKESGMVLAIVISIDALTSLFSKKIPVRESLLKCASVIVPIILGSVFYIVQKHTLGWYQYPGAFSSHPVFHLLNSYYWVRVFLGLLFYNENRYLFFLLLLSLSVFAAIKQKNIKYAFLALPAVVIYFLDDISIYHERWLDTRLLVLLMFSAGISVLSLKYFKYYYRNHQQKFIILSAIFFTFYLIYYSIYSFQGRYIFSALVILSVLAGVFFNFFISRVSPKIFYPILLTVVCVGFYCFSRDKGDSDLGAFDGMKVQQGVVNYFEQHKLYDKIIGAASYLDVVHLKNPYSGYLSSDKTFDNAVLGKYNRRMDYVVFESVELPDDYGVCKNDPSFQLVYRNEIGKYWAEIYARK